MEFLEKLYSQEYFAPALFIIIAILILLFFIVLILAIKDANKQKTKLAKKNNEVDAFAQNNEVPQEVNVDISNQSMEHASNNEQENVITEVNSEVQNVEPILYNSLEPELNTVSTSNYEPSLESSVTPIVADVNYENNFVPNETPQTSIEAQDNIVETQNITTDADVAQAENDLDAIAATLLSEYKKDNSSINVPEETVNSTDMYQKDKYSSVFVTPDTLANRVEETQPVEMPSLNDIPSPQPVRVTNTSTVIDSSKNNFENIQNEEYNINR